MNKIGIVPAFKIVLILGRWTRRGRLVLFCLRNVGEDNLHPDLTRINHYHIALYSKLSSSVV